MTIKNEKLIAFVHTRICRTKGQDYAPTAQEINDQIEDLAKNDPVMLLSRLDDVPGVTLKLKGKEGEFTFMWVNDDGSIAVQKTDNISLINIRPEFFNLISIITWNELKKNPEL